MDCKDINELFAAYLDGEVTLEEREQIEAHLLTCSRCREELEALAATQENLRQALKVTAAGVSPSPRAWAEIRRRLEAEQHRVTILGTAKSKLREATDIVIRGLVSRQPAWRTVIASVLAIALIAGLAIALPSLTRQSSEALAAEIAQNSPQVQAALGDGEIKVVTVITIRDDSGTVICEGAAGQLVIAEVDLKAREVTGVMVGIFVTTTTDMPEITEADKQKAIDIARADPRVQELLDNGASIGEVSGILVFGMAKDLETGETEEFS
ncbi:MAG: zf-HC2 domain-containing protein, partial [Dehalococcoidia bacterium]|nr:zf-HC2 domain-containing protein [Dehalococcoidia bacterium]